MKKRSLVWILALIFVLSLSVSSFAVQGVNHGARTITIGWFGPLTGILGKIGDSMVDGMKAKIDQVNARGGVGGYRIKLIAYDDNFNPILSKQKVKQLVKQDRVFAIVGALGSIGINAVLNDLVSYGIPSVYFGGGEPHWSNPPKRNIFPVQPDYITEGRLLVKFAVENLKARRLSFIYDNNSVGRTALRGAKIGLARYGRRLGARFVLESVRDAPSVMIAKLKKENPDATIVFSFFGGCAGLISAAKRAGINTHWVTTYVNSDSTLYKITGKRWIGVYVAAWAKAFEPVVTNYIKYFRTTRYYRKARAQRIDAPSGYHTAGWIALEIFLGGLNIMKNKYGMRGISWDNYIRAMESMRNFNNTIAKDITYFPMSMARPGTPYYYLARSGQRTLYFTQAALTAQGQFYLRPVTKWMR